MAKYNYDLKIKDEDYQLIKKLKKEDKMKVVIKKKNLQQVIMDVHIKCNHNGQELTIKEFNKKYFYRGNTKKVIEIVKNCTVCKPVKKSKFPPKQYKERSKCERLKIDYVDFDSSLNYKNLKLFYL